MAQIPAHLRSAVRLASAAGRADATWPWPMFQLAELATLSAETRSSVRETLESSDSDEALARVVAGDAEHFYEAGCRLAATSSEFPKDHMGGRLGTYVLADPHGLLSDTFVAKPTSQRDADRERAVTTAFADYLRAAKAPSGFLLPTPLAIVKGGPREVLYFMRRARGRQLGALVLEWRHGRRVSPEHAFTSALAFLSMFHRWGATQRPARAMSVAELDDVASGIAGLWRRAGAAASTCDDLRGALLSSLPQRLPPSAWKKDAHPENWLVSPAPTGRRWAPAQRAGLI